MTVAISAPTEQPRGARFVRTTDCSTNSHRVLGKKVSKRNPRAKHFTGWNVSAITYPRKKTVVCLPVIHSRVFKIRHLHRGSDHD
jgi:hypothetical protein